MNQLYNPEVIYHIPESRKMDKESITQRILIICREADLAEGGSELLGQIMGALNLKKEEDYTIIELKDGENINFSSCLNSNSSESLVFSFGLNESELCLQAVAPYYTKAHFENATLIRSHSIKELKENKDHKGSLWSSIKEYKK